MQGLGLGASFQGPPGAGRVVAAAPGVRLLWGSLGDRFLAPLTLEEQPGGGRRLAGFAEPTSPLRSPVPSVTPARLIRAPLPTLPRVPGNWKSGELLSQTVLRPRPHTDTAGSAGGEMLMTPAMQY